MLSRAALCVVGLVVAGCAPHRDATPTPAPRPAPAPVAPAPAAPVRAEPLGPEASPIDFERIARWPEPGWHVPRGVEVAPDGRITFLAGESGGETMSLWAFDAATRGASVLLRASDLLAAPATRSREEELRRERQRKRIEGITEYAWAERAPVLVVPLGGDVFAWRADGGISRLTETPEPELDPRPCADGSHVAFVRGRDLGVVQVATGKQTILVPPAPDGVTRGQSDFNGQEEFDEPSGYFWAPGCDRIAYLEVDERGVGEVPVVGWRGGRADVMLQRYPLAGGKNPRVRVGVVELATRKTRWIALPGEGERYLGRFAWTADGSALLFQTLSRDQKRLALVRADPRTGQARELSSETASTWIDFAEMRLLERRPHYVWSTVLGGHVHLELRDRDSGARVASLTSGDWDVTGIVKVDEERGRVVFAATLPSPLERQVFAVPLAGGESVRLTRERGVHLATAGRRAPAWVDLHSASDRLPAAVVRDADGAPLGELPCPPDPDLASLAIRTPEFVSLAASDGTPLFGALLRPRRLEPGRRYPAIVMVYGGPGVQTVLDQWAPRLLWQHLADRGFVVLQVDNRGSAGRGRAFEEALHRRFGSVELEDQLAAREWLARQPFVDATRMGIYGHSYGGFMALAAMLKAPGKFQAAVAGSPLTDARLYDTGYTERFMDLPEQNPEGYDATDLSRLAERLQGRLLIVHALMDENVHFDNTARMLDALIAADRPFEMLVFPGERHGYRGPAARRYAFRRVVDFFVESFAR
jgi:dipeptidyl-peptidase-4